MRPWTRVLPWVSTALLVLVSGSVRADDPPLAKGTTIDFAWDGGDAPQLAWFGRAYIPAEVEAADELPVVVYLHGLNKLLVKHRWLGGGPEDDLRRRFDEWIEAGTIPRAVLLAPSSIVKSQVSKGASWRGFDLDHFMKLARRALHGRVTLDPERVAVAGHSGAGCSLQGGLATVDAAETRLRAIVAIDTCLDGPLAKRLAETTRDTHVVVGYQKLGWSRDFKIFERVFQREVNVHPPAPGILRELHVLKPERDYHNATVPLTLTRWLSTLLE